MAASHAATRCTATALLASLLFLAAAVAAKGEGGAHGGPDAARAGSPMDCVVECAKRAVECATEVRAAEARCVVALERLLREAAGHGAHGEPQKWRSKPEDSTPPLPSTPRSSCWAPQMVVDRQKIVVSDPADGRKRSMWQAGGMAPALQPQAMASAARTTTRYAPAAALASLLLLLLVATAFFVTGTGADTAVTTTGGDPDPPDRRMLDCTMRCVTEAMGCATRCASARADEAPVCAAACVQADIGCLGGCGLQQPQPAP
uniref:Uncharacterized protein n=2 Tax=Setaria italica TaxID=4555 RepID=K3YDV2_SETIT